MPILEAMSAGVPVIASNSSSLPEVGGEAAIYFDPKNPSQLTQKIEDLLKSPAQQEKYSTLGMEHSKNFSWSRGASMLFEIIRLAAR